MSKILITGANGFIGQNLIKHPFFQNKNLLVLTRKPLITNQPNIENVVLDLHQDIAVYSELIRQYDVETIIHLAASVHSSQYLNEMDEQVKQINIQAPLNLAAAAIENQIKKFIFMSTIGVHGSEDNNQAISENTPFAPTNAYTQSKALAETNLQQLFTQNQHTKLHIIRPPMVYGPNSLGSFRMLIKALQWNLPVPFKHIHNQKSFISINNLTDFITRILQVDLMQHETFVIADKECISTTELITILKTALNSKTWNYALPPAVLKTLLQITKKENLYYSLYGNSVINTQKAKDLLNWEAPYRFQNEITNSLR